jgi:hypothetical protein
MACKKMLVGYIIYAIIRGGINNYTWKIMKGVTMREEAIVEVFGSLVADLTIRKMPDGRKFGETIICVNKTQPILLPVIVKNQELLEKEGFLFKKGYQVLLIGELEFFACSYNPMPTETTVISLNRPRSLTVINSMQDTSFVVQ